MYWWQMTQFSHPITSLLRSEPPNGFRRPPGRWTIQIDQRHTWRCAQKAGEIPWNPHGYWVFPKKIMDFFVKTMEKSLFW